jgi:hypothetical protein
MKISIITFSLILITRLLVAQEAHVISFKHTVRWLNESNFPNYFIEKNTRDSIYADVRKNLQKVLNATEVELPGKVEYKIISGFGKPKDETEAGVAHAVDVVDIFSVLTRATTGVAVFWSVHVIIRNNGEKTLDKEAKCEIENANAAGYMLSKNVRWLSPVEFRKIFSGLLGEALGTGQPLGGKVVIGSVEEKEKEVRSWFPNSTRYLLKTIGAMQSGGNFSAMLVNENDTILRMNYENKLDMDFEPISAKPLFAQIFTDLTGIGTAYTIKQKEHKSGLLEFSNKQQIKIFLEWIEEVTYSTTSDETTSRITVPLVAQLVKDNQPQGEFVYQRITEVISTPETKEKFSLLAGNTVENSYGTAIQHRVNGNLNDLKTTVEYDELFSFSEIKVNNETLASMIFQNCNSRNPLSFNEGKISKNKKWMTSTIPNVGKPKLNNEEKLEWYPVFIKNDASTDEIAEVCELLVCLFFAMGNM